MLLMAAAAVSLILLQPSTSTAEPRAEPDEEIIVLPFETGGIRQMDASAEDDTETCFADGEGDAFERLARQSCPPGSDGASEAQRRKPHRLGMEAITTVALTGDPAPAPPSLTFRELSREEVELQVQPDGRVRACRHVGGEEASLCDSVQRGEFRFLPFAGTEQRTGRISRLAGFCHSLDRGSCGSEDE